MNALFSAVQAALLRGEDVVLCTILASSGSSPRGAGARMAVFADGAQLGTIGGGAVERSAAEMALEVHRTKMPFVRGFSLRPDQVSSINMICGGQVTVYFQLLTPGDLAFVEALLEVLETGNNAWLVLQLSGGVVRGMGLYEEEHGLRFTNCICEEDLAPLRLSRAVYQPGEPAWYVEPISRAGRVYLFGGGHVGKALVPVLARIGFRVTVVDDRPEFAKKALHPAAEAVLLGDYQNIAPTVRLTADDYVIVMTPGHMADRQLLLQALRSPASYIGCIGSRRKVAATNQFLVENGIPEADLSRVHSPIGLSILAETPEEIAISIAAQLIEHRARRALGDG